MVFDGVHRCVRHPMCFVVVVNGLMVARGCSWLPMVANGVGWRWIVFNACVLDVDGVLMVVNGR